MNESEILHSLREKLDDIKRLYHVNELGLFGSYIKSEQTEKSDIDIVVDFQKGNNDLFNAARLKFYLEELLKKDVDLTYKQLIKPELKEQILSEIKYV